MRPAVKATTDKAADDLGERGSGRGMSDLPGGWCRTTVRQVSKDISYGFTTSASRVPTGPKLLRITDIQNGAVDWDSVPFCKVSPIEPKRFLLKTGDIVFARTGATTGKSFLIPSTPGAVFASYLIRLTAAQCILPEFLAYFFRSSSYWKQITENLSGSAQPNCNASKLASLDIAIPPLNEQQRIVAKLEELLSRVDAAQARLATIPRILRRFRQSVLAAACSGRLTADWREEDEVSMDNWSDVNLKDVASLRLGKMLDKAKNIGELTPYLRNINVRWFTLDLNDLALLRATDLDREELSIRNGDLLICEGGEPGRCAVWIGGNTHLIFQKAIHRVRFNENVSPDWVAMNLKNDAESGQLEEYFTGSTIQHLTGRSLAEYEFALPSLAEQREIVRRVDAFFKTADAQEAQYHIAKAHVDKLTQSILAKAFRGELVPQDPTDEPASVLLNRIKATRNP